MTENILGTCTCAEHCGKGGCLGSGRCRRSVPCGQQGSRPGAVCPPLEWDTFALAAPYPVLSSTAGGIYGSSQVAPVVKKPACQCRRDKRLGFDPWVGKIPWRRAQQPTPAFFPGESHGQRSLAGCSPWGHTESDTIEVTKQQPQQCVSVNPQFIPALQVCVCNVTDIERTLFS